MTKGSAEPAQVSSKDLMAINFFAFLCICGGVGIVIDMLYGLFNDQLIFNLGFLIFFVGQGLLNRSSAWIGWAKFITWLFLISIPIAVMGGAYEFYSDSEKAFDTEVVCFLVLLAPMFVYLLWLRKIFSKKEVLYGFEDCEKVPYLLQCFIAIALLFGFMEQTYKWSHSTTLKNISTGDVVIKVYDKETKEVVRNFIGADSRARGEYLPKISISRTEEEGLLFSHLSWVANKNFKAFVGADGYEEKHIEIDIRKVDSPIKIFLEKKKSSKLPESTSD